MRSMTMRKTASLWISTALSATLACFATGAQAQQVELSQRHKDLITIDGLRFKDLNDDGALNPYEDWRLPAPTRAADLVGRMTVAEKIGLMVIGTQQIGGPPAAGGRGCPGPVSDDGLLCEARVISTTNMWAEPGSPNATYPAPVVRSHPTTEAITTYGVRRFIIRDNPDPRTLTRWINRIQEVAEQSRLGVPVVMTSNPRNHATQDLAFGFTEASGMFSVWPGTLGLAATRNVRLVNDFARIAASEWNATGIRAGYMYMADLATDPRWFRIDGTFGDDPGVAADMIRAVVTGFQGAELSAGGVLLTTKHFPGGGPRDRGMDPHYIYGQTSPYPTPGSLFQYHLPPFAAAIDAGTAAIMPYYALPSNARSVPQLAGGGAFEEVGFSFNRAIISDLLRGQMGFEGYVNSDSGILFAMPWGEAVEDMDYAERAALAINAGVDVISDMQDVSIIQTAYERGLISDDRIDEAAQRLAKPMFQLGLFESPYRDPDAAQLLVADSEHWARAYQAHQQSVVTLKNDGLLPLTDEKLDGKVIFVEALGAQDRTNAVLGLLQASDPSINFTQDLTSADYAIVFLSPADAADRKVEGLYDLEIHAATGIDLNRLRAIQSAVPTIVAINLEMPWLVASIEPDSAALLAGFGTRSDATLDVIRGRAPAVGRLPFTLPVSLAAVVAAETNGPERRNGVTSSDVPGFARGVSDGYTYISSDGAKYRTGYGIDLTR